MSDDIGCVKCSRFCIERTFLRAEEWATWVAEERIGDDDGIFAEVYSDGSPETERMTAAVKCIACGQMFVTTANTQKSNKVKVAATWKPVPRRPN